MQARIECIIQDVCRAYGITEEELKSRTRRRHVAEARHMVCYLLASECRCALTHIGAILNRSHATVIHSLTALSGLMEFDASTRSIYQNIKRKHPALTPDE